MRVINNLGTKKTEEFLNGKVKGTIVFSVYERPLSEVITAGGLLCFHLQSFY
jgi:hypothetical protein